MPPASPSSRPKRFLFDRSFDDLSKVYLPGEKWGPKIKVDLPETNDEQPAAEREGAPVEPPPPPPPEKKYTEDDLEAAREEGQIAGHTAALEDAETSREHYVADALNLIGQRLDGLEEQQAEANRNMGETAMRMVYAVVEKVLPDHAQAFAMDQMEALVREVLPLVYDEPTIVVRVHNMVADDVQTKLDEICERSNFNGSARVVPDYELQPGDCRVEWEGGGADRSETRLWSEIRNVISDNVGSIDVPALDAGADDLEHNAEHAETSEDPATVVSEEADVTREEPGESASDGVSIHEDGENPPQT